LCVRLWAYPISWNHGILIDIQPWVEAGLWRFHAVRPTAYGLESHLAAIARLMAGFQPDAVVVDPITAFENGARQDEIKIMLMRLVDMFKGRGATALFTSLTQGADSPEETSMGVSSLVDCWLLLRNMEVAGERSRGLYVLKSRGMAHSNQVREFRLSDSGVSLMDVEIDADGNVLLGAARVLGEQRRRAEAALRGDDVERRRALLEDRRRVMEARVAAMQAEFEGELSDLEAGLAREEQRLGDDRRDRSDLVAARMGTPR